MTSEERNRLKIKKENIPENSVDFAYVRISFTDQNEDRQVRMFTEKLGINERNIFIDYASGKNFNRQSFQALKSVLRKGDRLHIMDLKRFGRNYTEIKEQWQIITKEIGADIISHNEEMLNTTAFSSDLEKSLISDIILCVLSYGADKDYQDRRSDQKQGIDTWKETGATKTGRRYGRPKIEVPDNWQEIITLVDNKEITKAEAMRRTGLKKDKFYEFYNNKDYISTHLEEFKNINKCKKIAKKKSTAIKK